MTYLIIHSKKEVLEREIMNIINRYLGGEICSLQDIYEQPDFYILQPEEKESITIEQGKQLQKDLIYSPFQHKYQFGIILNSQLMTTQAQNSLLKTLEEKSEKTILILTVNNERSVLDTILSRCTRIYPKSESTHIQIHEFKHEEEFMQKPIYEKISYIENVIKQEETKGFLEGLTQYFKYKYEKNLNLGKIYTKEIQALETLRDVKFKIEKNVNKKIALEYLCFKLEN